MEDLGKSVSYRGYASGRYGQIHYRAAKPESGDPSTWKTRLLCLHPSPLCSEVYVNLIAEMGRDRLVIAADTPGFGLSDPPPQPVGIADFAGAMTDLLDAEGIETANVFGHHTGTATAVELALQQPGRIRKVAVVSALMHTKEEFAEIAEMLEKAALKPIEIQGSELSERYANFRRFWPMVPADKPAWDLFFASNTQAYISHWGFPGGVCL